MGTFGRWVALFSLVAGCGTATVPDTATDAGVDQSAIPTGVTDAATPADAGPLVACPDNPSTCTAYNVRSFCTASTGAPVWQTETCPAGCFAGQCSATECADECTLGDKSSAGTCRLWNLSSQSYATPDPVGSMHDRARDYERILRSTNMAEGAVLDAVFTDTTYSTINDYAGTGDASIWTGTALGMQAWRLLATGDPDAAHQLATLVATVHGWFNVSGDPGYLARLAVPSSSTTPLEYTSPCTDPEWHCGTSYAGQTWNWLGYTSRDQNTGVMLGYYLAYIATTDESIRATIRTDVVTMVTELMKSRQVPTAISINGLPSFNKTITLENVILAPSEMTNGRVQITISTSDASDAGISGMREFLPDFGTLVDQILGVNIPIPRASTTMMLGGFFKMAELMTDGVPGMEATHDQLAAYYVAHAPGWLTIAEGWTFTSSCGNGYFANHIAFIMAYVYAMLETDPVLAPRIRDNVVNGRLWAALEGHKNSYFAFLWGGTRSAPDATQIASAVEQLGHFSPGPRIHLGRDHTTDAQYMPHDTTCSVNGAVLCDTATLATDVQDRTVDDFIWQRQPWALLSGPELTEIFPGVDYLAAYWAGRRHGFIADDNPGTCTRYAP